MRPHEITYRRSFRMWLADLLYNGQLHATCTCGVTFKGHEDETMERANKHLWGTADRV